MTLRRKYLGRPLPPAPSPSGGSTGGFVSLIGAAAVWSPDHAGIISSRPYGVRALTARPKPRLLVLTPDFPPAYGGIQLLVSRLVEHLERFDIRVVTFEESGAESSDRAAQISVRRVHRSR